MKYTRSILYFILCSSLQLLAASRISIMLDPAGDAQHAGRVIDDSFERGITLQFADQLKKRLEEQNGNVRVILTRFPGETLEPLQNANFANRLMVDLYISIHCYSSVQEYRRMHLYYFLYNPITDLWKSNNSEIMIIPFDEAHKQQTPFTKSVAQKLHNIIAANTTKEFIIDSPLGFPFKPLIGITTPAIGIEVSLQTKDDFHFYLEPLTQAIESLIPDLEKHES